MTKVDPKEFESVVKASLAEATEAVQKATAGFREDAEALKTKNAELEVELKKHGAEYGDTKAKVTEIAGAMAKTSEDLQKANQAIQKLHEMVHKPRFSGADERTIKGRYSEKDTGLTLKDHAIEFAKTGWFSEDDQKDAFDEDRIGDEYVERYKAASKMFWNRAMRTPARQTMVEHGLTNEELKALEPLMIKKTISTVSHGSRYWLTNEMYGDIIACYDEVTDLSRLFSQVAISRNGIEVMRDNDVEKRALFRCEIDCQPGRNETPMAPGTVVIPTHELYDRECITHTMIEDSEIDLEMWLIPRVAEGFTRGRNEKFMWGRGTAANEPEGLMMPGNHIEMPAATIGGSAPGQFTWQHLRIMPFQVAKKFQAAGSYMFSRDALMALFTMADGDGKPLIDSMLSIGMDGLMRFMNYPIIQIDQMQNYLSRDANDQVITDPTTGAAQVAINSKPIGFGAWSAAYLVVDRKGFFVIRDPAYNPCGVTWHFGQRVGGGVLCQNASVFLRIV